MVNISSLSSSLISNREHSSLIGQDLMRCWNSETLTASEKGKFILRVAVVAGDALYESHSSSSSSQSKGTQVISCIASVVSLSGEIVLKKIEGQDVLRDSEIHMKSAKVIKATGQLFNYPAVTLAGHIATRLAIIPPAYSIIRRTPDYIRQASDYIKPYLVRSCMVMINAGVSLTQRIESIREQWHEMGPLTREMKRRKFSPIPEEHHTNPVFRKYI